MLSVWTSKTLQSPTAGWLFRKFLFSFSFIKTNEQCLSLRCHSCLTWFWPVFFTQMWIFIAKLEPWLQYNYPFSGVADINHWCISYMFKHRLEIGCPQQRYRRGVSDSHFSWRPNFTIWPSCFGVTFQLRGVSLCHAPCAPCMPCHKKVYDE